MESYINIDKNMVVSTTIGNAEVIWRDVRQQPFALHGFYEPLSEPFFRRLPEDVASATSEGVKYLSRESAGGRVRFSTNSPYIAIRAKMNVVGRSSHLTLISSAGFDLYIDGEFGSRFVKEFRMPYDMVDTYEQIIYLEGEKTRTYTINFPVHSVVETLEVGIKPDATLGDPAPYRDYHRFHGNDFGAALLCGGGVYLKGENGLPTCCLEVCLCYLCGAGFTHGNEVGCGSFPEFLHHDKASGGGYDLRCIVHLFAVLLGEGAAHFAQRVLGNAEKLNAAYAHDGGHHLFRITATGHGRQAGAVAELRHAEQRHGYGLLAFALALLAFLHW